MYALMFSIEYTLSPNGYRCSMSTMLREDACDKGVILALPLGQYPFMDTARQVAPITRSTCAGE